MVAERVQRKKNFGHEVADVWLEGEYTYGRNDARGNIFFEGDSIFSYGRHFTMGRIMHRVDGSRWVLVNGDTYSRTTSGHQASVRAAVVRSGLPHVIVPFSALERAGIEPHRVEFIDKEPDREIPASYKNRDGEIVEYEQHLMGASLLHARYHRTPSWQNSYAPEEMGAAYFLSGLDETAAQAHRGFFLAQLAGGPYTTVAEGYEALVPPQVRLARAAGADVQRQGEHFFVALDDAGQARMEHYERVSKRKGCGTVMHKGALIPNRDPRRAARHAVTRLMHGDDGAVYVRGRVRHTGQEHRVLTLGGWYQCWENLEAFSARAAGNVD